MITQSSISVVIATNSRVQQAKALALSQSLSLPLGEELSDSFHYHLVYTDKRLELQQNPSAGQNRFNPISVDFLQRNRISRRISSLTLQNPLAKAVGVKAGIRPFVVDATAGLGIDGISLLWLGCRVILVERSPVIHALLKDGLERLLESSLLPIEMHSNLNLLQGDTKKILIENDLKPDVILIDPMFPATLKGPLNKKEMRILREIVGDDADGSELVHASIQRAAKRVVVKRPKGAEPLISEIKPSHQIAMKSGRFDVYLTHHL